MLVNALCFCFIPIEIRYKLLGSMDGTQFLWLSRFPAKNHPPQTFFGGSVFLSIWKFDKPAKKQGRKLCELFKAAAAVPMQFRAVGRSENPWEH